MSSYPFNTGIIFGRSNGYVIAPFSYQARGIIFAEWANLFTLCLAPLIAHIFGGAPKPVYLSSKPPLWHERLWQYNPTSILWRYFVITDRRIRAKSWAPSDMAASNAYFWTNQGWDGSLQMLKRSRAYCLRQPTHHRVRLLSGSTLTTLIITIQGVMAIKTLIDGVGGSYAYTINISSIFYPLAVFGLLRIFAAMWLTDDYLYYGNIDSLRTSTTYASDIASSKDEPALIEVRAQTTMSLLDSSNESFASDRFHRTNSWRGILFRIIYLVPICCLLAICFVYLIPAHGGLAASLTTFLMVLFYAFFLAGSMFLYGFYFLSGRSTNSIIPCHNTVWYKIYSGMVMAFMFVLVILACLETRKSPCGVYTTYPRDLLTDWALCPGSAPLVANQPTDNFRVNGFGLVEHVTINANGTANATLTDESLIKAVVVPFTGLCFGTAPQLPDVETVLLPLNDTFIVPL
ncbi:hypothetical protein ACEPPN_015012 [Leptodophora sp. 'Broadleaf-Isolate-01']